jgi:pyruvate,water dikinase
LTAAGQQLISLDDDRAGDATVVGAKAAALAHARRAGLPVRDGFVLPVGVAAAAVAAGTSALSKRNSGFARAAITGMELPGQLAAEMVVAAAELGERLVVRSSSVVESSGAWAGAFASYSELAPPEVPVGVKGCWASLFSPDALGRAEAYGLAPAEVGMAVLVQAEIDPEYGGVATVGVSGTVTIVAVAGPPAQMLSGWEPGHVAVVEGAEARPAAAVAALGAARLGAVAGLAREAASKLELNHIEWAEADGVLWLLQAQAAPSPPGLPNPFVDRPVEFRAGEPAELVAGASAEARRRPSAGRLGVTAAEPRLYEIVSANGLRGSGEGAAAGWGAGRMRLIRDAADAERFQPREVVAAVYPLNNLAPLLWNAAGLITIGGAPGAHLFEVAAWLGVPAVCGVDLEAVTGTGLTELAGAPRFAAAVDGAAGAVALLPMEPQDG